MRADRGFPTPSQQAWAIWEYFPQFKYKRHKNLHEWRGTLHPDDKSPIYQIRVRWEYPAVPQVWVTSPEIVPNARHLYSDGTLCLFYPADQSWTLRRLIARTIIPWSSLWLWFYGIWLDTDTWYGPEVNH